MNSVPLIVSRLCTVATLLGMVAGSVREVGADDPDEIAPIFSYMQQSFAEYEMSQGAAASDQLIFRREPIYQWTVLISGRNDGALFVWLNNGRPEVAGCVVTRPAKRILYHEFHSLSQRPVTARLRDKKAWFPSQPGLQLTPVPGAPIPASNAVQRRIQMRNLAREFSVSVVHPKDESRWETRMLARPVYQYSGDDESLLDGGLFLFVRGNDPQLLVVLEATSDESVSRWQYGLARLSSHEIEIQYDQKPVQTIKRWPWRYKPTSTRPQDEPYAQFMMGVYPASAEKSDPEPSTAD